VTESKKMLKDIYDGLLEVYNNLLCTEIYQTQVVNEKTMGELENTLNNIKLTNHNVRSIGKVIRFISKSNKNEFNKYLKNSGMYPLILLTDGIYITEMLNIKNKIFISWDINKKIYRVKKYIMRHNKTPKNTHQVIDSTNEVVVNEIATNEIVTNTNTTTNTEVTTNEFTTDEEVVVNEFTTTEIVNNTTTSNTDVTTTTDKEVVVNEFTTDEVTTNEIINNTTTEVNANEEKEVLTTTIRKKAWADYTDDIYD